MRSATMAKPQKFSEARISSASAKSSSRSCARTRTRRAASFSKSLFSATFKKHPYGKPVIGYVKTLKAAKVGDARGFLSPQLRCRKDGPRSRGSDRRRNGARKKSILKTLEKYYGSKVLPKREGAWPPRVGGNGVRQRYPAVHRQAFRREDADLCALVPCPGSDHEDTTALDLLSGILGCGELSRLYQKLFYQISLVTEVFGRALRAQGSGDALFPGRA